MALRKFVEKFTKPVDEQDREQLVTWCTQHGRHAARRACDCASRCGSAARCARSASCPAPGADALEATVQRRRGALTAVFLGRRKIVGTLARPARLLEGVVTDRTRSAAHVMYNPVYEFAA